ncbi:MAG: hypothetical protein II863_03020 [Kiritimatiellae bacterium]|nr:hypothetical protein [Kiritimatiellia bacterium]
MGMLLDDPNGVADIDMRTYWENQLKNDKIILSQVDRAIAVFNQHLVDSGGVQEYTIETGQDRQTVRRSDLASLYSWRQRLVAEINQLSNALYGGSRWSQVLPGY